jgi:hypothetical protein
MTEANSPFHQEDSNQKDSFREEPSDEKELPSDKVVGMWHITGMEVWDAGCVNMETQAYIRIEEGGTGDF